jgi:glycosyltransferase involved in cell wall biosynthesis
MNTQSELSVWLVANCRADRIESMQRFGDCLARLLPSLGLQINVISPEIRWGRLCGAYRYSGLPKWLGYIDKYLVFPRRLAKTLAVGEGPMVVHVLDHGNAMYVPTRRRVPWVVTCHDLLTIRAMGGEDTAIHPSWSGRQQQRWILRGLKRADHIACDSRFTRDDLHRICPDYPSSRTSVVLIGLNHPYREIGRGVAQQRLATAGQGNLVDRPYVLHVGSNQSRKNRDGVLRIVAAIRGQRDLRIVFAGQKPSAELLALARELGLSEQVAVVEKPANDLLEALYNFAHVLLFPSRFEGFGWPVIEAQACGCPVVCSNTSSLPEVAGDGACLHGLGDEAGMARSIEALFDPDRRAALIARGRENVRRFSAMAMAQRYAALYHQLSTAWNRRMPQTPGID